MAILEHNSQSAMVLSFISVGSGLADNDSPLNPTFSLVILISVDINTNIYKAAYAYRFAPLICPCIVLLHVFLLQVVELLMQLGLRVEGPGHGT